MNKLMRARELITRPVVTLGGDDIAQIKDVVYDDSSGSIEGFTLNKRSRLGGPLKEALAWDGVLACGSDAVMVHDDSVLQPRNEMIKRKEASKSDVLRSRVVTRSGKEVGEALHNDRRKVLVPLPDTMAVAGEALVVPDEVLDFVSDDLAGFGAAVDTFRARLGGRS